MLTDSEANIATIFSLSRIMASRSLSNYGGNPPTDERPANF
jgi:hypothetical protein